MTDPWNIYDNLVLAKEILGRSSRFGDPRELNDAIDRAYRLLDDNLPELASVIEDMEETDEDSP